MTGRQSRKAQLLWCCCTYAWRLVCCLVCKMPDFPAFLCLNLLASRADGRFVQGRLVLKNGSWLTFGASMVSKDRHCEVVHLHGTQSCACSTQRHASCELWRRLPCNVSTCPGSANFQNALQSTGALITRSVSSSRYASWQHAACRQSCVQQRA